MNNSSVLQKCYMAQHAEGISQGPGVFPASTLFAATLNVVIEFRRQNSRIKIRLQLAESRQDPYPSTLSKSQALKTERVLRTSHERATSHEPLSRHGMMSHHTEY